MQNPDEQKFETTDQATPFHNLPLDILNLILRKLNAAERMKVAQTCKDLNVKADNNALWKLECQDSNINIDELSEKELHDAALKNSGLDIDTCVKSYKQLFFNSKSVSYTHSMNYYIVGNHVEVNEDSSITDRSYPYPKFRKNIPKEEILSAYPREDKVSVFQNVEDAQAVANSKKLRGDFGKWESVPVIFAVAIKEGLCVKMETKKIYQLREFYYQDDKKVTEVECFTLDRNNIVAIKSAQVSDRKGVIAIENNASKENKTDKKCIIS